jgi:hypothetical protein
MGYREKARSVTCGHCGKQDAWYVELSRNMYSQWRCHCGALNRLQNLPEGPNVPTSLHVGPDQYSRFKVYAAPPEAKGQDWAQPYSIRSFAYQASERFDATGQDTCALRQRLEALCPSDAERRFLKTYLEHVEEREFPMLIPQAWIGILDDRRPDFVAFVPLQYWKYKWLAIELDAAHPEASATSNPARDEYIRSLNYETLSLRPMQAGYLEEVRNLVGQFERWMTLGHTDPGAVAVEASVRSFEPPPDVDVPF